jgi:hypothetical protein
MYRGHRRREEGEGGNKGKKRERKREEGYHEGVGGRESWGELEAVQIHRAETRGALLLGG